MLVALLLGCVARASDSYFDVCSQWRELSSPWPAYSCWEHSGFPVCVLIVDTQPPMHECKEP
jgi:hypothetical protein